MTTLSNTLKTKAPNVANIVKPLKPQHAIWHFLLAGLALRLAVYQGLPLLQRLGLAPYEAYAIAFIVPTAVLFALAFGFAQAEGVPMTWAGLAARFRLRKLTWPDIGWGLGGLLAIFILGAAMRPVTGWMMTTFSFLQPPAHFPPLLNPMLQNEALPGALAAWAGPQAAGNWGYVLLAVLLFFFNNAGEELYWRGLIFPRQEKVHGRTTWLIHGLMWNLFHVPVYPWYAVSGLGLTLIIAFVAQKTQNSTAALLLHALANIFMTFLIIPVAILA